MYTKRLLIGLSFLLLPLFCWASDSPEKVSEDYLKAFERGGMTEAIIYFHPEALAKFHSMLLPAFKSQSPKAQNFVKQAWGESLDYEELQNMPAKDFAKHIYAAIEKFSGINNIKITSSTYLGTIKEGDNLAHVLMRNRFSLNGTELEKVQVVSLKSNGDSWGLLLSQEMEGTSKAFQKMFEN